MIFFMFNGSGNIDVIIIEVFKLNEAVDEEAFGWALSVSLALDDSSSICKDFSPESLPRFPPSFSR